VLKFVATRPDGRPLIGLGLSRANTERLLAGQPIAVELRELNLPWDGSIVLLAGETEESLGRDLRSLIGPETEVHVDPRLRDPREEVRR
jgi:hypothetical protein